jgi:hypothetical protein
MRRSSEVAALSVVALLAAGCASVGSSGTADPTPTSKFITSPAPTAPSTGSPSVPPAHGTSKPKGTGNSPFASLRSYLASRPAVVTAAVYDQKTGKTWVLHPGVAQDTASIVKVEIMGTALKQAQDAGSPLPGTELSLVQTMIENSDNNAATSLLADVGGPDAVKKFDDSVGMTGTTPHATTPYIDNDPSLPAWGLTTTTASDEVKLISRFAYPNSVLNATDRSYGLNLMENVEADQRWGVTGGVPDGVTVALKNGWLPLNVASNSAWQVDSIGWIHGNGRDYVLAVLSDNNPTEQTGIDTIDHIAAVIYSQLGG